MKYITWLVVYKPTVQCRMYRVARHYLRQDPDEVIPNTRKTADPMIDIDECVTLHMTLDEVHNALPTGVINMTFPDEDETIAEVWLE